MARNYKTGVVITGDSSGGVKAIRLTDAELKKLNSTKKRAAAQAKSYAAELGKLASKAGAYASVVGGAALVATGAMISKQLGAIDTLAKTSDKLGIATEKLAQYRYAAELTGLSSKQLDDGLQRMTRRLSEAAQGTGVAVGALEELGLSAEELIKLSPDRQFEEIADAMGSVENQSDRVRLAFKLFDKEGVGLVNTLKGGSAGLAAMGLEAQRAGIALTRIDAAKIEAANDSMHRSKQVFNGFAQQLTVQVAPVIERIAQNLFNVASESGGVGEAAEKAFNGAISVVGVFADGIHGVRILIKGLEVGVKAFAATSLSSWDALLRGAAELANKIPGINIDYEGSSFAKLNKDIQKNFGETKKELDELLMKPLPSEAIKKFAAEAQKQSEAAAAAVAEGAAKSNNSINGIAETVDEVALRTVDSAEDSTSEYVRSWEKAKERIDATFADMWKGAFDSFKDFSDRFKDAFKQLLAELAHQALTKPILISLGLGGTGSAFGSSGINAGDIVGTAKGGFGLTDLLSGGGALAGINGALWSGVGYAADFLTNIGFNSAANTMVSAAANMSQLPGGLAGGGLLTAAGGYVGGQAGNAIGEGLFGKEAEHSYGQIAGGTIGGIAGAASGAVMGMQMGAWAGPVGALIGAALGALADVAFGGDGKKRVSLGVHAAPNIRGRYRVGSDQAESGLEFTAISRRAGKKGDQAARDMMDAFILMDSTMVAAAETLGQTVDLTGVSLTGKHVDAGHTGGAFFGSAKYNKVDSAQLEEAAGEFVTAWGDAVGGKFDETLDVLTAGLSMKEISDHAGGIISAVGLVGSATGDLKVVLDTFVPTLDDTQEVASDLPFWWRQLNKAVSGFPFADLIQDGEVAATALTRLSLNLVSANEVIGSLGMEVLALDEAGIRAADTLTGLFGGVDAFAAAADNYATAFMTDAERFVAFQDGMKKSFVELNAELPETRREFQQMVEALDLADEAAQKQFAAFMALVPVMDEYFQALEQHQDLIASLETGIAGLIEELYGSELSDLQARIATEQAHLAAQQRAADELYRTEQQRYRGALAAEKRLSDYVDSLQLGELSTLTPTQQLAEARAQFEAAVSASQGGDAGAAQDATRIASSYLKIARDFYASSGDYRDIFLGVNQQLNGLAGQFGGSSAPAAEVIGESDTLADLRAQLAELQAGAAQEQRQGQALDLAAQLGELGLAKDESIHKLLESMGVDLEALAADFGINLEALDLNVVGAIASMAEAMGTSSITLLDLLGTSFAELAEDFGVDIQNLNSATAEKLVELGDSLNLTTSELLGNLGLSIDTLDSSMKSELEALGQALGLSNLELLEGMGQDLAALAESFGVDLGSLDLSMTDELRALGDVFNLAIGSLAEELDINLSVLPVAIQEAVGYTPPPEPETPVYDYDTWADWLAAGQTVGWDNEEFLAAYQDWFANNNPLGNWSWNLASFDVGTDYVPRDMTANIHKGEKIIDPQSSEILNKYGIRVHAPAVPANDDRQLKVLQAMSRKLEDLQREVNQLRRDNAEIAGRAEDQREEGSKQAQEDAERLARALRQDINTRKAG